MRLVLCGLALIVLCGCSQQVDLTHEKSPDAKAGASQPAVSTKPNSGFKTQSAGSGTGLR